MNSSDRPRAPKVSVLIPAYDEARYIRECLEALKAQTYGSVEIIVVDDGSTDGTAAIAERVPGVMVLRQGHIGSGTAKNLAARHASGDILVFVDADMVCVPEFIERLIAPMVEGDEIGTFTREFRMANPERPWARTHVIARGFRIDEPLDVPDRWEVFRAVWRTDFERVGGFDAIGHGEDVTIGRKLGALAAVAPGAIAYHYYPDQLRDIHRSGRWYGAGERITEEPRWPYRFRISRTLMRAAYHAVRHRSMRVFIYRLVFEHGIRSGVRSRGRAPTAAK